MSRKERGDEMEKYLNGRIKSINENNQRRIETLFDAVIAIAMTMMALEIVIPQVQHFDFGVLCTLFSEITVYLISYIVLASIWIIHTMLYSSYSSLGGPEDILINIIIMFVVTIFPILTKLMAEYNNSALLRCIYISTYFFIEIIMCFMLVLTKRKNMNEKKVQIENVKLIMEMIPATHKQDDSKFEEIKSRLNLAEKYLYDKEISENLFQELMLSLPQTVQDMYYEKQNRNNIDFHKSICFLSIGFATVAASVAVLMINPFLCYFVFLIGGIACLLSNTFVRIYHEKKKGGNNNGTKIC
ncbi:TMEM175 family protein [Anaerocolumna jejuensis]|nr:TMEM175 family protein [Anaerocolumna jejuensis]